MSCVVYEERGVCVCMCVWVPVSLAVFSLHRDTVIMTTWRYSALESQLHREEDCNVSPVLKPTDSLTQTSDCLPYKTDDVLTDKHTLAF